MTLLKAASEVSCRIILLKLQEDIFVSNFGHFLFPSSFFQSLSLEEPPFFLWSHFISLLNAEKSDTAWERKGKPYLLLIY